MIPERFRSTTAQTQAEYSIVIFGIGIAVLVVVLFFGGAASGLWDRSTKPVSPSTFNPPDDPPVYADPSKPEDCQNGGWKNYPRFAGMDEQACLDYVATLTG